MLKRKPPAQLELFVAGSLEQLVPDDHILAVETGPGKPGAIAAPRSANMRYGPGPRISMQAGGKHRRAAPTGRTHESA